MSSDVGARTPRHRVQRGGPGPGPGIGLDRDPDRAATRNARILLVATIVVGQLWALTLVLDSWFRYDDGQMWLLVGFEALSFVVAVACAWVARQR
jgi:hypothetical protein